MISAADGALRFESHDGRSAAARRTEVGDVYRRSYVERIARGDEFGQPEAFLRRFDTYVTRRSFVMVVAKLDDTSIGQAWGWPLASDTGWWNGLVSDQEPDFTREDGRRTFALSEIMVDRNHQGHGVAHALHDRLLSDRSEERATLLVNPANTTARTAYERWGWRRAGALRPAWPGAALLDVLIRTLPGATTT